MSGRLRGSGVNVVEGGLRYGCLLAERVKRLLNVLRSSLAESSVLLGVGRSSLGGYDKSSLVSSQYTTRFIVNGNSLPWAALGVPAEAPRL